MKSDGQRDIRTSLLLFFFVCGLALVVSNVLLARRLGQVQKLDDLLNASNKLELGRTVPALVGYDLDGKKVSYGFGQDSRDTLLLVLAPGCHACDENWPNWTRLLKSLHSDSTRTLIANIASTPPITADYLARHGAGGVPIVAEVSAESAQAYHLAYTPQTILIDRDGKVRKVKTGLLQDSDFLQSPDSALPAGKGREAVAASLFGR
jgi:hypothetical protein